jgi:hypothetical protein
LKFVPVRASVVSGLPTYTGLGNTALSVGELAAVAATETLEAVEDPPPGVGLVTRTGTVPTAARSVAPSVTTSCVLLRRAVGRAEPFTEPAEPLTKPVPVMVTFAAVEPAATDVGERLTMEGAGLSTVKVTEEVIWPAVTTATGMEAALASCEAVTVAVSCELLTKLVTAGMPATSI